MSNPILNKLLSNFGENKEIFSYQSCFPLDTKSWKDSGLDNGDYEYVLKLAQDSFPNYEWKLCIFDNIGDAYNEATGPYKVFLEYKLKDSVEHE